ncbi:MAG: thiamine pyrophosphate-dependent enzyme, partial [Pseudomonadota bacterium]
RDRYGFHGLASGGIGWSLPAAVGIQLANPERPVTTIVGDGSAMYSVQSLWTAAHHRLPMTYIICNNGGYRIIKQRLKSFHGDENYIGMDFEDPALDWVGLAKSLGVNAIRVEDPAEIGDVLKSACTGKNGPTLIDAVVEHSV